MRSNSHKKICSREREWTRTRFFAAWVSSEYSKRHLSIVSKLRTLWCKLLNKKGFSLNEGTEKRLKAKKIVSLNLNFCGEKKKATNFCFCGKISRVAANGFFCSNETYIKLSIISHWPKYFTYQFQPKRQRWDGFNACPLRRQNGFDSSHQQNIIWLVL